VNQAARQAEREVAEEGNAQHAEGRQCEGTQNAVRQAEPKEGEGRQAAVREAQEEIPGRRAEQCRQRRIQQNP